MLYVSPCAQVLYVIAEVEHNGNTLNDAAVTLLRLLLRAVSEEGEQDILELHPKWDTQSGEDVGETSSTPRRSAHHFEVDVTANAIQ
jgi:hypothetical protein